MSRDNLAALISSREAAAGRAEAARVAIVKLQATQSAPSPIEAELSMLDAAETNAAATWARDSSDAELPAPDVEARSAILLRLNQARAGADAARRATAPLEADMLAAAAQVAEIVRPIEAASAEIVLESIEPLIAKLAEQIAALAALQRLIDEGRLTALATIEALRFDGQADLTTSAYRRLERLDAALRDARDPPLVLTPRNQHWAPLMQRLAHDAEAQPDFL